jgi:heat shock protein HslJ
MGGSTMAAAAFSGVALALLCAACTSIAADQRTFEGTRWRVIAIDGRPTPTTGEYEIAFSSGRVSARFGCNSIGGTYAVAADTVTTSGLISTMMACGDPADSFEHAGSAVLNVPMRTGWSSSQRLRLSNSAGSIDLEHIR